MDLHYWGAGYVCLFGVICVGAVFSLQDTLVRALVGLLGLSTIGYGLSIARETYRERGIAAES